mgnify:CR=1 FL=1
MKARVDEIVLAVRNEGSVYQELLRAHQSYLATGDYLTAYPTVTWKVVDMRHMAHVNPTPANMLDVYMRLGEFAKDAPLPTEVSDGS